MSVCMSFSLNLSYLLMHAVSMFSSLAAIPLTHCTHPSVRLSHTRTIYWMCGHHCANVPFLLAASRLHCQPSCSNRLAVLACVHIIREDSSAIAGRHSRPTHLLLLHLHEQEEYKLVRVLNCQLVDVGRYLTVKITEGETHHITCPGFGCSMLVPVEIIEKLVSREMARRYLQFDIKVNL